MPSPDANPPHLQPADERPADERPLRILVRSDSQGTSLDSGHVPVTDERLWANVLGDELRKAGTAVEVRNASVPGMKVGEALLGHRFDPLVQAAEAWADVITITLGINDLWPMGRPAAAARVMDRARPMLLRRALRKGYRAVEPQVMARTKGALRATPAAQMRRHLRELVDGYLSAGHGVAMVTPYPVRSTQHPAMDGNTGEASDLVCEVAAAAGVPVVDCRTLVEPLDWRRASEEHVHVGPDGHRAIALAVRAAIEERDWLGRRAGTGTPPGLRGRVLVRGDAAGELARPGLVASLGPVAERALRTGFSVQEELRSLRHDPLVREPTEEAAAVLLDPTTISRPSAWEREQLALLVDEIRRRTTLVLVDDQGPWSTAIRAAGAASGVSVATADGAALRAALASVTPS